MPIAGIILVIVVLVFVDFFAAVIATGYTDLTPAMISSMAMAYTHMKHIMVKDYVDLIYYTVWSMVTYLTSNHIDNTDNIRTGINDMDDDLTITPEIPVPVPTRTQSGFDPYLIESHIYTMTNEQRKLHGLSELSRVDTIDSIARMHSLDMSERGYFNHETPEGLSPTDRGDKAGYGCRKDYGNRYTFGLGENILMTHTYSSYTTGIRTTYNWLADESTIANQIVDGWMDSPGHRENILTVTYDKIGIGVAINSDEQAYATQNFC